MAEKKSGMFDKLKESVAKLHDQKPDKVSGEQMAAHVQAASTDKDDKSDSSARQGAGGNGGGGAF